MKDNKNKSIYFGAKICTDICPWTLSVFFHSGEGQGGGNPGEQGVAEDGKQENKGREAGDLYEGGRREQK